MHYVGIDRWNLPKTTNTWRHLLPLTAFNTAEGPMGLEATGDAFLPLWWHDPQGCTELRQGCGRHPALWLSQVTTNSPLEEGKVIRVEKHRRRKNIPEMRNSWKETVIANPIRELKTSTQNLCENDAWWVFLARLKSGRTHPADSMEQRPLKYL